MELKKSIQLAINHIKDKGLTDTIIENPFELKLLNDPSFFNKIYENVKDSIEQLKNSIDKDDDFITIDKFCKLNINELHTALIPKRTKFGYRKVSIIDPLDCIKYHSLVFLIAEKIEQARNPKTNNIVFSYRFSPNNNELFDSAYNYESFINQIKAKVALPENKIIVYCDIASFYERLNLHRLESELFSLGAEKKIVLIINELLLFWAKKNSYGLPIGSNASRILAEASLIPIDNFLISNNINFCRFVDDYRFFAPDSQTAHYWLTLLIERLSQEGLMINQYKTSIQEIKPLAIKTPEQIKQDEINKMTETFDEAEKSIEMYEGGYSGDVPLKFVKLTDEQKDKIRKLNEIELYNNLHKELVIEPSQFESFCKVIQLKNKFELFKHIPDLLEKYPQFTPYSVDLLLQTASDIPDDIRNSIKSKFINWLNKCNLLPEYIIVSIIRLLSSTQFHDKEQLWKLYQGITIKSSVYLTRSLLESLEKCCNRQDVKEILNYYSRATNWDKRQIIKLVKKRFESGEKAAWFKLIKVKDYDDLFINETITSA